VKPLFDMLTAEPDYQNSGCDVYDLAAVRGAADAVIDLEGSAYLAMRNEDGWVSFAVFDVWSIGADEVKLGLVFHGSGPSGYLRELRHTYWGDEGYLFDPSPKVIVAAFDRLKEWFDV
jgi:hypothetical protein